jgi:hypothetical protein
MDEHFNEINGWLEVRLVGNPEEVAVPQVKTSDSFSFFLNRNHDPRDLLSKRDLLPSSLPTR